MDKRYTRNVFLLYIDFIETKNKENGVDLDYFERTVEFPSLSKKLAKGRIAKSIGLDDWSTKIQSRVEGEIKFNNYVEICLIKGSEDVDYEIIERERDIIIRYKWKDYVPFDSEEEEEFEEESCRIVNWGKI